MKQDTSRGIGRRNFLNLLLTTGAGALAVGVLRALNSPDALHPNARSLIKNIVFFIQENHSFDSLFAGFPVPMENMPGRTARTRSRGILLICTAMPFNRTVQPPKRRTAPTPKPTHPITGRSPAHSHYVITITAMCAVHRFRIF